jgi:two-component system CheB/CheR fusion protein
MAAVPDKADFYVVGIGASAGGLAALRTLFSGMPSKPGYACVVVTHLSPEHESHLVELLQPYTQMPVQQVRRTTELKPNHVYVIPPNANLNTIDTHLRLSELEARRIERATVDHFLRTLAEAHDGRAVAVILTGAGSDGSMGVRLVKESGGLTIAQDPAEAEYDSMPRSAITTGTVDLVLPVRQVPEEIARYCSTRPHLPARPDDRRSVVADDELRINGIVFELRRHTGQDFSMYRRAPLLKRIRHRMQLLHITSLGGYLEVLRADPAQARALQNDVLLHVTDFFQDAKLFQSLEQRVFPAIFAQQPKRVRVWSIACSTGEEAYSLAMLLIEQADRSKSAVEMQVFASDISEDALQRARQGLYPHEVAVTVGQERLERFFSPEKSHFRIRNEVRQRVIFASHDLFKDPPYSHLNVILCRHLLHELQPEVRGALLNLFYYALEEGGVLVVGPQDSLDNTDLFEADDSSARIFRRRPGSRQEKSISWLKLRPFAQPIQSGTGLLTGSKSTDELYRSAIERYAPPTVLIDSAGQVLRYSTAAHRYIRIPGGEFTNALTRLLPAAMSRRLEQGLAAVARTSRAWASEEFGAEVDGLRRQLVLRIDPLGMTGPDERLLVIFDERPAGTTAPERAAAAVSGLDVEFERANAHLVQLLAGASQQKPSPELLQDLRVMLEQLDGSREELRTVNEELTALDAENRGRITALAQTSDDMRNILESAGVATLVLNERLRIMRFTESAAKLLRLTRQDVGRRLRDVNQSLMYEDFEQDAERVIAHQTRVDRELPGDDGRQYLARMLPYRAAGRGVEGVVISFIDITDRKRAEAALRESDEQQRLTVQLVPALLWWTDPSGKELAVNYQWKNYTGQSENDLQEFGWLNVVHPDEREEMRAAFRKAFTLGEPLERQQRVQRADGEYRWHLVRQVPVRDATGTIMRWFGAAIDVHELRLLQDRQQTLLAELQHRTRNLITVVRAVSDRTIEKSASLEDFQERFGRRLAALARVQRLLSHLSVGERVTFDQLLDSELNALGAPDDRVSLSGPAGVPLRSTMVQTLALAIHELATNAVKYGALSPAGGHLQVRWHLEAANGAGEPVLHVEWKESGVKVPNEAGPTNGGGYGRELIEKALPYQLRAKTSFTLGADGVYCTISIAVPADQLPVPVTVHRLPSASA